MTCLTCPQGHREYHKYDSLIRCQGRAIPVLAAYNTAEAKERTGRPHWCPIDPVEEKPKAYKLTSAPKSTNKLFTDDQIRDIRMRFRSGTKIRELAKDFKVSWTTIQRVTSYKRYQNVV